ncbi:MAG TPA: hypothetical protein EYP56_07350 [Planctomycetaceae bacterium]|nr:hypothetical protein [Planctomycetaceae bacterium]
MPFPSWTRAAEEATEDVIDVGSRRELFVDGFLIDRLTGEAELRLHHPRPRGIAIVHDAPWEGSGSGYHTVFQDGDVYRMYYRGWHLDVSQGKLDTGRHRPFYCYAESSDGVHWRKPELGIVEFDGSKKNNIILEGLGTHNFAPFKDGNPDCPPEARYKALAGTKSEGGLFAFQSADGIHWSLMTAGPVITDGAFDSQNLAFWDPTLGKYRAYWRIFTAGVTKAKEWRPSGFRAIRTGTSSDFLNWGEHADLTYVDSPDEHLYTNQVNPYYRAPHILIGFPTRYLDRGWSASMRALPERENRELRASASRRFGTALTEGLLMASRDGVRFKRWNEAFLRPGIQRPGTWQYGQQYIACHVVETASSLPGAPNELSIYATEGYWHGKGGRLRRYTLRLDGFVSASAPMKGGELITKPLKFDGARLVLNFATSAAGSLRVEIQDLDGNPIEGFSLADCPDQFGDSVQRVVTWKGGADVKELAGHTVRLRFVLKDADLFAFQFQKE